MIAASGGRTAGRRAPPAAVAAVTTSNPASRRIMRSARRIWCSSSHHEHALLAQVTALGAAAVHRQLDHEARALARAATPPASGRRWPRRTRGRSPAKARPGPSSPERGGRARRSARGPPWRSRARGRRSAHRAPAARRARAHGHRLLPGEARGVLQHVGEGPLELGGIGVHAGRSGSSWRSKPPRRAPGTVATAARITSSTPIQSCARLHAAGLEPVRSSRLSTSRERRPLSPDHRGELGAAPRRRGCPTPGPPAAAVIAVSGERRSWETERRSAVFTTFAAPQRLGLDHLRLELLPPARGGHQGLETRNHAVLERVEHLGLGVPRAPARCRSGCRPRSGEAPGGARRCPPSRARPTRKAARRPARSAGSTALSESSRLDPPRSRRAISADRSASRRRRSASSARARAARRGCS